MHKETVSLPETQTYFAQRMSELGITEQENEITITFDCFDDSAPRRVPIFSENPKGGIDILYVGLNGLHTYFVGLREKPYVRTRLHPSQAKNGY